MAGRHRAPKKSILPKVIGTIVAATSIPLFTVSTASADPALLEAIAACESGNRNVPTGILNSEGKPASSATGYLQIIKGTWLGNGGGEFAPRAMDATRTEQFIVGERILKTQGLAAWSESEHCWRGKKASSPQRPNVTAKKAATSSPASNVAQRVAESYVVKRGDTLFKIAQRHDTTWQEIFALNRDIVEDPNRIFPNQKLKISE